MNQVMFNGSLTFSSLKMRLLYEIWHSTGQLENDGHGLASSNHNLIALRLLSLRSFAASYGLIVKLFFPGAHLSCCRKFIQQRYGSFVIVCSDTRLGRGGEVFDELEDISCYISNSRQSV